jgi:hypothetical protein
VVNDPSGRSRTRSAAASSSASPQVRPSLDTRALGEAADWMDRQRALWGRLFDVVDEH